MAESRSEPLRVHTRTTIFRVVCVGSTTMPEDLTPEEKLLREVLGDDWDKDPPPPGGPTKDLLGRPFGEQSDDEIEAEVRDSVESKRRRRRELESELESANLSAEARDELKSELERIDFFLSQIPDSFK